MVRTEWVVYAKPPWGGAATVLKYLARYTHKAAISNHRLVDLADGRVSFRWKDYAHGGRPGIMTLDSVEFVRRFLMHVLPSGFVRVRHYGLLANRHRQEKLARCRELLGMAVTPPADTAPSGARSGPGDGHRNDSDPDPGLSPMWRGPDGRGRGIPADALGRGDQSGPRTVPDMG